MRLCTVSMTGQDGRTETIEVEASSVFDAASQAARAWSMLWWYRNDAVITVRAGEDVWRVRAEQAHKWQAARASHRKT